MSKPELRLENGIARVTLRAEERKNAISREDIGLMTKFLKEISEKHVKCLILTGEGNTFSSGMYLEELTKGDWSKNPISEVCDLIEDLPFISICFLNGGIYGGSVEMALSCDFRIGASLVKLKIPAAKFGIHYGVKGIRRCVEVFGLQLSRKLLFLGHQLNFKDLTENGFLDFYAEDFEGSQIILKNLVGEITLLSLDAIREMKATLNDLRNDSVDLSAEESRFSYGFKTGIVAQRLKTYKNL
tara:strand:- start:527 stop:1255 length:729 start_codon:yes stop_codon:yes gene_type:complete